MYVGGQCAGDPVSRPLDQPRLPRPTIKHGRYCEFCVINLTHISPHHLTLSLLLSLSLSLSLSAARITN